MEPCSRAWFSISPPGESGLPVPMPTPMLAMDLRTALLTSAQMAEADRLTLASGMSAINLMDNAGRQVANEIRRRWAPRPVIVLCGHGSNALTCIVVAPTASLADAPCLLADLCYSGLLIGPGAGIGALTRQAVLDADALAREKARQTTTQGQPCTRWC